MSDRKAAREKAQEWVDYPGALLSTAMVDAQELAAAFLEVDNEAEALQRRIQDQDNTIAAYRKGYDALQQRLAGIKAELRVAAGMLSTLPQFSNDHPEKVLQYISTAAAQASPSVASADSPQGAVEPAQAAAPLQAHSKSQYKRLVTQGANVAATKEYAGLKIGCHSPSGQCDQTTCFDECVWPEKEKKP